MKLHKTITIAALTGYSFVSALNAQDAASSLPTQEEMWQMIQAQQKQIEALQSLLEANQAEVSSTRSEINSARSEVAETQAALASTQQQIEATTLAVEEIGASSFGTAGWWDKTSIGGYGELHANFYQGGDNEIDFHRFVLFVNHDFNDWISLYSEIEIEHTSLADTADGSSEGEVKLEQAFVRFNWTDQFYTDAGLFLMPVGILNETHEPNTFYGVERNNVEARIIPTTWFEGGARAGYRFANGLEAEAAVASGLDSSNGVIRSGRQDVAKAKLNDPAFVGRINYSGISGLELGGSVFYQDDLSQTGDTDISALLTSVHAVYKKGGFGLKALYARWDLQDTPNAAAEEQFGYFIEPSYRWTFSEEYGDLGIYFRFSEYEYFDGMVISENTINEIGVNYWPNDNVVLKVDFQDISDSDQYQNNGDHAVNLGVGYQF